MSGSHDHKPPSQQVSPSSAQVVHVAPAADRPVFVRTRAGDYYEQAAGEQRIGAHFSESRFGVIKLIVVLVVLIGGMVIGFSYMFKAGDTLNDKPVDPSRMHHQLQMMRHASEIANEVRENERLRMEQMRRVMQAGEQFGAYDADERFFPEDD
ncbi:MAG: hypothetical protein L0Y44_07360 [Phycisphaerales bacterium]|nr:hypothetical protein [Phycisphaerales bacterium]MCI0630456.1 hypothetical protein [Phycisphaerales bacterium]MCI0674615.1 hypothetical protein [Phycisphaerales bacterium]